MVGVCGMDESLVSFQAVQGAALSDTNIVGRVLGDPQAGRRWSACCTSRSNG